MEQKDKHKVSETYIQLKFKHISFSINENNFTIKTKSKK